MLADDHRLAGYPVLLCSNVAWPHTLFSSCPLTIDPVPPQDIRLWTVHGDEDLIVCNDEKLASGGTASYLEAARKLVRNVLFEGNPTDWPDAILAPAFLVTSKDALNHGVQVMTSSREEKTMTHHLAWQNDCGSNLPTLR